MAEPNRRARPMILHTTEYMVTEWYHAVPPDVNMDQLLDPAHWTNVARRMQPHQRVRVDCEDGSWTALLFVRDVQRNAVQMAVQEFVDFDQVKGAGKLSDPDRERYDVRWGGPAIKYRVIRLSDGEEMARNMTKAQANEYVESRILVDEK